MVDVYQDIVQKDLGVEEMVPPFNFSCKRVVVLANLPEIDVKGHKSKGMLLTAVTKNHRGENEFKTLTTSFGMHHYHRTRDGKRLFLEFDEPFKGTFRGDSYPLKPTMDTKKYDPKKILKRLKLDRRGHLTYDGHRRVVANYG